MVLGPRRLVGAQFFEGEVLDFEESTLLQVGRSNAPPAPEVMVKPVADDVAEGQFGLDLRLELEVRIFRETRKRKGQRLKNFLRENVVIL